MTSFIHRLDVPSNYKDNQASIDSQTIKNKIRESTTLYVGNLSFTTSEEQLYELFSKVGYVRRVIMGLDRNKKTPCGFCFIEYNTHEEALDCLKYISGTKLDERHIRTDLDYGFEEGRQYGRGKSGGQVRDEFRDTYDSGRGGWGKAKVHEEREEYQIGKYRDADTAPTGDRKIHSRLGPKRGRDGDEESSYSKSYKRDRSD